MAPHLLIRCERTCFPAAATRIKIRMIVRAKAVFSPLSWLIFLAYLIFGVAGGVAACCSEAEGLSGCAAGSHAGDTAFCLTSSDPGCGSQSCLDHCPAMAQDQVHLAARPLPVRLLPQLAPLPAALLTLPPRSADTTGFLHAGPPAVQDSVRRALRSVVLLI